VQQYVGEVEARARVHAELLEERTAKEHALFLHGAAEKRADKAQVRARPFLTCLPSIPCLMLHHACHLQCSEHVCAMGSSRVGAQACAHLLQED
jgi:hypothetical protein